MNPPAAAITDRKVEAAKAFARQFTHFEWEYLCSYQWFLTGIDRALETGDIAHLQRRAEQTLVDEKIRSRSKAQQATAHFAPWLG